MTTPPLPLSIMETWSPEQKLAVYDLCRLISEILWQHDRDGLLEAMIRDDHDARLRPRLRPRQPQSRTPVRRRSAVLKSGHRKARASPTLTGPFGR